MKKGSKRHDIFQKFTMLLMPLALVWATLPGCEGPQGPEGAQGTQGPQGSEGLMGPAGEDGSVIHGGKGAPVEGTGKTGDFYLDQGTGELYGPKNDHGWGTPITLKGEDGTDGQDGNDGRDGVDGQDGQDGADGQDGEDGSQIYAGTGSPDVSLGVTGDYYLDKADYELYGPKTGSGWERPISLKGTANVIFSSWTTLDSAVRDSTIDGSKIRVGDINAPQLSQEILDQGVINVYMRFFGSEYMLPHTGYAGGAANVLDFLPRLNTLLITRFTMDNSGSTGFNSSLEFRYVIIPGGVAAKNELSNDQLQKMSYREIQKLF